VPWLSNALLGASQAVGHLVLSALAPAYQAEVLRADHFYSARGVPFTWDNLEQEFLHLVGATCLRSSHEALAAMASGSIRQTPKQFVTD
jgi:hypothetical protein